MSCNKGKQLNVSVFGQSHADAIGVVVDGFPAGFTIDFNKLQVFMDRRAPGRDIFSTARKESDVPEFLSGIVDNKTCGAPLCAVIKNTDTRSKDYSKLKTIPRPSHSDYPAFIKYNGNNDIRGGGAFSGRLTAPLCIAGGIALQMLDKMGVHIAAHIYSIAEIKDKSPESFDDLINIKNKNFPVIDDNTGKLMQDKILAAKSEADSVGGVIEVIATGLPVGIGGELYDGLDGKIAYSMYAIPAVKGVEFGEGFASTLLKGSENNDEYYYNEIKEVKTKTNHHGGVLGGMTTGMPIICRITFKPTPSIGKKQQSVNLSNETVEELIIQGRHDPCIVPRAVPCVEAMMAIELLDSMLSENYDKLLYD